jgi:hypothetical protein
MSVPWLFTTMKLALVINVVPMLMLDTAAQEQRELGACGYYTNSADNSVPRLCDSTNKPERPASRSTTLCGDGTYSYSQNLDLACSDHGRVVRFLP